MKKILGSFGVLAVVLAAVVFLDIGCMFRHVVGVPCPGCGTTRAWICFLQGHVVDAFYWHPLFWLTVPLLFLAIIKQQNIFRSSKANRVFWFTIFAMYLSVYIVRMVLLFPDTAPMDYNKECLLAPLYEWLRVQFSI
ncbi:MAG: DUF2752 domain-containing protein [Massiliimalia sp.]|jgi:hypothetical protein